MTVRENAQELLDHLAETLQCGQLVFNQQDAVELGLDEDMGAIIYLLEEDSGLVVSVVPGRVNPEDSELLYDLLCGNYMWGFSGGGNIGVDRETGLLSIHRLVELPLDDAAAFEDIFAALVGAARYWRARLTPDGAASAGTVGPADMLKV